MIGTARLEYGFIAVIVGQIVTNFVVDGGMRKCFRSGNWKKEDSPHSRELSGVEWLAGMHHC